MNKDEMIGEVRKMISAAQTEKALQTLIDFFEGENKYDRLQKIAIKAKGLFAKTEKEVRRGTINSENANLQFNRINETVLLLLEDLEKGNLNPSRYQIEKDDTPKRQLLISALTLLFVALGVTFAVWRFAPKGCPDFASDSVFNLLLLPFETLAGDPMKPEIPIKERLTELCGQHKINGSIEIFKNFLEQNEDFPTAFSEAEAIAKNCSAKMIVWGTSERIRQDISIKVKFKYLTGEEKFSFRKIKMEGETQVDTIKSISSIATEGTLTRDLENLIRTLFGIVAVGNNKYTAAIENLQQVIPVKSDTNDVLLTNMLLAESYLATNDEDNALKTYDRLLDIHPNYGFALNNRGMLLYRKGQYYKATQDFSNLLKIQPDNVEALKGRGFSNLKLENIKSAQEDFKRVEELRPDDEFVKGVLKRGIFLEY